MIWMLISVSPIFRASRFCIRASQTGDALARWAGGSKTLMLSPDIHCTHARMHADTHSRRYELGTELRREDAKPHLPALPHHHMTCGGWAGSRGACRLVKSILKHVLKIIYDIIQGWWWGVRVDRVLLPVYKFLFRDGHCSDIKRGGRFWSLKPQIFK